MCADLRRALVQHTLDLAWVPLVVQAHNISGRRYSRLCHWALSSRRRSGAPVLSTADEQSSVVLLTANRAAQKVPRGVRRKLTAGLVTCAAAGRYAPFYAC